MKKFILAIAAVTMSLTASAQFANAGGSKATGSKIGSASTDGWTTIWAEWNPTQIKYDINDADDESVTGLSVGVSRAYSISSSHPLFVEAGLGIRYTFDTRDVAEDYGINEEVADPKIKTNMFSLRIPVDLLYAFQVPNSKVTLIPFVGANLRFNLSGNQKFEWNLTDEAVDYMRDRYGYDWERTTAIAGLPSAGWDHDVFDKKDMGSSDATWKRFQIGWRIGVKARFNDAFLLGLSYGSDFSELAKKTKVQTTSITIGYTF